MANKNDLDNFIHESIYKSALKYMADNPDTKVSITETREIVPCWACKNGFSNITFTDKLDLKYELTRIQYCPICGRKV